MTESHATPGGPDEAAAPGPIPDELAARLHAALGATRLAGAEALRWFDRDDLVIEEKRDLSPVTAADRAAEAILRQELLTVFPDDAFLGEESGATPGRTGYEWIVDPIDGTRSFIRGVPLFATLVGCRQAGRGIVGVISIPALDEMVYAAVGGGAWHVRGGTRPRTARVSRRDRLDRCLLCTSDFTSFAGRSDGSPARAALEASGATCRTWGDGYGYLLVATGRADVMIDPVMNAWDAAAVETVIREAGGSFTDWQGRPRIDSGDGVATNGLVHAAVLALVQGATA
jgi:histidinol-phosphatase